MDKVKIFNAFADSFSGFHQDDASDDDFYRFAFQSLKNDFKNGTYPKENILSDITFFAFHRFGRFTLRDEEPIMDIEEKDLPINYTAGELEDFILIISTIIDHFQDAAESVKVIPPVKFDDFLDLINRKERLTLDIPAIWLNI